MRTIQYLGTCRVCDWIISTYNKPMYPQFPATICKKCEKEENARVRERFIYDDIGWRTGLKFSEWRQGRIKNNPWD